MPLGGVVVLNGTASAGKTTLACNLHALLAGADQCWIVMGLDDFFSRLPPAWITYGEHIGAMAGEGIAFEATGGTVERRVGPIATRLLAAYRAAVAAVARAGINVIVD